ncbi:MAG TPA: TetR/AcrR family transcriptional regulator [Casimicrobiaceae bacterium]|jgi:AcrR family transcriptional regulator
MAERKRPRRTRERIVETSLQLFNRDGAPHVTTADIADEMGISPGNLYYHFRNKDQIIAELFAAFEQRLERLFAAPTGRIADVEDLWLFLHLLFEAMWEYRFLYRDLDEILSRHDKLEMRFTRLIDRGRHTMLQLCSGMVAAGAMEASQAEIAALADNVALVATYWMSYQKIASGGRGREPFSLDRAAYQVLSLIGPFLRGPSRTLLARLSLGYL